MTARAPGRGEGRGGASEDPPAEIRSWRFGVMTTSAQRRVLNRRAWPWPRSVAGPTVAAEYPDRPFPTAGTWLAGEAPSAPPRPSSASTPAPARRPRQQTASRRPCRPARLGPRLGRGLSALAADDQRVDGPALRGRPGLAGNGPGAAGGGGGLGRAAASRPRAPRPGVAERRERVRPGPVPPAPPARRDPAPHRGHRRRVEDRGGAARRRCGPGRCRCDVGDAAALCGRGRQRRGLGRRGRRRRGDHEGRHPPCTHRRGGTRSRWSGCCWDHGRRGNAAAERQRGVQPARSRGRRGEPRPWPSSAPCAGGTKPDQKG